MPTDDLVIETENLTRAFKNVVAVDGLNLSVRRRKRWSNPPKRRSNRV